ncbi:MAG: class IV adenylate cyclase [Candidatus Aminicenantes bacterium]|nr:MAG: class IV adenylate cyclase [Candidatus Aminicenantes bacterium]
MIEIEVKIRINDIPSFSEKISNLGATVEKERFLEENSLYDFRSKALEKKQQALRLRRTNKKILLTFKGPPQKSRKFKIREEHETEVRNEKQLRKILKSLGLQPVFNYQKYRTVYRKKNLKVCLDEMDIGNFIELEGERNEIAKFAKALGFSKDEFIKLDYVQLIKNEEGEK